MKLLLDMNVFIDLLQNRELFCETSGAVISLIVERKAEGYIPSHHVTTLYYLLAKYQNREKASDFIDWALNYFTIIPADRQVFLKAQTMKFNDFEDAVTAACAEYVSCDFILTRNTGDFELSKVPAIEPVDFLSKWTNPE